MVNVDLGSEATFTLTSNYAFGRGVIAIRLLDSDAFAFLGGVKFFYSEREELFTVVTAVNGRCEALLDFTKSHTIKSGEIFLLSFDNQDYALQFVAITRQIKINFTTTLSP